MIFFRAQKTNTDSRIKQVSVLLARLSEIYAVCMVSDNFLEV